MARVFRTRVGVDLRLPGYGDEGPTLEVVEYRAEGQRLVVARHAQLRYNPGERRHGEAPQASPNVRRETGGEEVGVGITKEQLLENLNGDLAWEYAALIQYVQHASVITGAEYESIVQELLVHANEEMQSQLRAMRSKGKIEDKAEGMRLLRLAREIDPHDPHLDIELGLVEDE